MTKPQTARQQLEQFLSALFRREELIELRFIESWLSRSKKRSRVVRAAEWLTPDEVLARHGDLTAFARRERANIYFGVCPRAQPGDADDRSIQTVRCIWCDVDRVTVEEVRRRWSEAGIPRPSIVVSSGSGVHAYWLLKADLTSPAERASWGPCSRSSIAALAGTTSRICRGYCVCRERSTTSMPATAAGRCLARFVPAIPICATPWTLSPLGCRKMRAGRRLRWPDRVHIRQSSPRPSMQRPQR